ncbi:MAG: hypothetical protein LBV74_00310 [Tannerella sp.]|jgi:hypothetical protein|nr:hypothetical protein [Tannerella sp.]
MSYAKLYVEGEVERRIRSFSTDYFYPDPEDKVYLTPRWIEIYKRWGRIPKDYVQPVSRQLKDFDRHSPNAFIPNHRQPFGGLFRLTMESTGNDDFFYKWMISGGAAEGRLEFFNVMINEDMPFRRLEFWDGWVCNLEETMSCEWGVPMLLHLEVSPATVRINKSVVIQKSWFITEIPKLEYKSAVYSPVEELYVRDVKGDSEAVPGQEVTYEVTRYSRTASRTERDKVVWGVMIDGKTALLKIEGREKRGEKISFKVPEEWKGKEVVLMPYLHLPDKDTPEKEIKIKNNGGGIWIHHNGERLLYTAGMTYNGDKPFVKSTIDALNQLAKGKFGGHMISEMQNSDLAFNISQGGNIASANFNDPMMKFDGSIYMTGADIKWDANEMITLGHEMAHGWDIMNGYDISVNAWDKFFNIPEGEVRAVHLENILRTEQGMPLRYYYSPLREHQALVNSNGKETRFGYDYGNNPNVPWNYGNGLYGTCRTNVPIIPGKSAQPLMPSTPRKPLVPVR